VTDGIIRVALERNVWIIFLHPTIERIVQEKVCQDWADDSPYAKGNFTFDRVICGWRRGLAVLDLRLKR
jgi:hypothetical protein